MSAWDEKAHGVTEEPSHTCPLIDSLKDQAEEIRDRAEELRTWGGEWKEKAIAYYAELEKAREEIDELTKRIEELEYELTIERSQS